MKSFFDNNVLLSGDSALKIYDAVKDLPIIDYHCHLDQHKIASDAKFQDIGELWLGGDHYKWRAMRMCGVDEHYITGDASWQEKFTKYAEIMPKLIGNPLYYWTHMELKQVFGISLPLNKDTAVEIYTQANAELKGLSVRKLLEKFNVEFVATTDDPTDSLEVHGTYGNTRVTPTFRPDKAYGLEESYIQKLANATKMEIDSAENYAKALEKRLDFFVSKGCKFSDHGFERFPTLYADDKEAEQIFQNRSNLSLQQREAFFGWLLVKLAKMYKARNITMQIHFAVVRNNNSEMLGKCGVDSGFDLIAEIQPVKNVVVFLNKFTNAERPNIVLYTLNDSNLPAIAATTGAFSGVRMGAAWWFNDTVEGIRKNLKTISEYSVLGTNLGMLTDSRSFSSYVRFDFFRRLLSQHVADLVDKGEYDEQSAIQLAKDICYNNVKQLI